MPELPEVETIRRGLEKALAGLKIEGFEAKKNKVLRGATTKFRRELLGRCVGKTERRGKMLILEIKPQVGEEVRFLVVRLGMTGQLIFQSGRKTVRGGHSFNTSSDEFRKHCRAKITFKGGAELLFKDARMFGSLEILDAVGLGKKQAKFGVEPLSREFTAKKLAEVLRGRKTNLKALLLNQGAIAGLGNIYVDESLFAAGILPIRRADSLEKEEIKKLHAAIVSVLRHSIRHKGTTFSDYRDASGHKGNFKNYLRVYHRQGQKCMQCGVAAIQKSVVAGRGTHFCPRCQR